MSPSFLDNLVFFQCKKTVISGHWAVPKDRAMTTLRLLLAVLTSSVRTPAVNGEWINGNMTLC
jgi:hypothetical protein